MGQGFSKRILLIDGNPATHEHFRQQLGVHDSGADSEGLPTRLADLEVNSTRDGAEGLTRLHEALSQHRPYLLALVALELGGPSDGVETVHRLWQEDPDLLILLGVPAEKDSAAFRRQLAERIGGLDRFLFVTLPLDGCEVRQLAAAQIDRRLARLETQLELRSMRSELEYLQDNSDAADRAKREFIATVSHEIRTPMNAILGFTRLLMKETMRADQAEKVGYVYNAATSLFHVVSNVLDLSRLSAGEMKLTTAPFDLSAAVQEVVKTARAAASEKRLVLDYRIVETVPCRLEGDEIRFCQILMHLLNNAIKFTPSGMIHLQVSLDEETEQAATLRMTVTDTGVGIPPECQTVIFDAFSQADGSSTRQFGGMGLGLAIAKRLVDLMDGQIGFQSVPGEGSCFWVILPFNKQVSQETGENRSRQGEPLSGAAIPSARWSGERRSSALGGKPRVLLAEDDRLSRTLAEMLLSRLGCLVDLVGTGRAALELMKHSAYDLLLMDVEMPEMDGLEAIRQIRCEEATSGRHVPILVLTACALPGDRQRCLNAGGDHYLAKPFVPEVFVSTVRRYLPRAQDPSATFAADRATTHQGALNGSHTGMMLQECLQAVHGALAEGDLPHLEECSGTLKQLSLRVGSQRAADHVMRMQLAARSNNSEQAVQALRKLEAVLQEEALLTANS
jgi:signal transduction histidine kinase/DNA-binding response OmpR family regulator